MLEAIAAGLITRAAGALGGRMVIGARKLRQREAMKDLVVARELDSYAATGDFNFDVLQSDVALTPSEGEALSGFLAGLEAQALVHELLAARILGSPEKTVARIDEMFAGRVKAEVPSLLGDRATRLSEGLFSALDERCRSTAEAVQSSGAETIERLRQNASYALILATLEAIERHAASVARADVEDDPVYEQVYRGQVRGQHGTITPPDFDRRKSVPLADLYVSPEISAEGAAEGRDETLDLTTLWQHVDRTVLLGEPGGGKSTATGALLHRLASDCAEPIPFLVVLRDYAQYKDSRSIVEYVEQRMRTVYQCARLDGFVERQLLSGRAAVFFDGLDELLDTSARRDITDAVQSFSGRYPLAKVFVTSRVVGYEQAPMDPSQFSTYKLANFSEERVAEYASKWFRLDPEVSDELADESARSFVDESRGVSDLRRNPLMLSLMCIMYRGEGFIPRNRPMVYERCATLLFEKWDGHRQIKAGITAEEYLDEALKHLAFRMLRSDSGGDGVTRSALIDETTAYLGRAIEDPVRARRAAAEFVDFCKGRAWVFSDAGTTAEGEDLFKFTHRTFMEYFAAYEMTRTKDTPERLARALLPHVARAEWDMVGQLAVAIVGKKVKLGASRAMQVMLDDGRKRSPQNRDSVLAFLARCTAFAAPTPVVIRRLAQEIFLKALAGPDDQLGLGTNALSELLNATQSEHFEYVDDEFMRLCTDALTSSDVAVIDRMLSVLLTLNMHEARHVAGGSDSDSSFDHFMTVRDSVLDAHASVLVEAYERSPVLRRVSLLYGRLAANEYVKALKRTVARGGHLLDDLFAENRLPHARSVRFATVAESILLVRNNAGWRHDILVSLDQELLGSRPPFVSASVSRRISRDFGIGRRLRRDAGSTDEPEAWVFARLVLWACIGELRSQPSEVTRRRRSDGSEDIYALLVQARAGDAAARTLVAQFEPPTLIKRWADRDVNFLERVSTGPNSLLAQSS